MYKYTHMHDMRIAHTRAARTDHTACARDPASGAGQIHIYYLYQ